MGKRTELKDQRQTVKTVLDLIGSGAESDLAKVKDATEIKYLKTDEEEWLKRRAESGKYVGPTTGYPKIDDLMGSFLPGEIMTLGGDTGHGKSIFAMNVAQNAFKASLRPVLFVTLELTEDQARERFYELSGDDRDYTGILVQKSPAVEYRDIDIIMKRAKSEDVCLVIIDHLHFFSRNQDNQTSELSRIMKHFKECAVENELPVMVLSHVTPKREYSDSGEVTRVHRPGLHNFKGSSSIEQDSDMVAFVYRNQEPDKTHILDFYMKKNRSRELKTETVQLVQNGWKLEEAWWEK